MMSADITSWRLRVGVIMGGPSREREVSFNSARTVCDHLDTALYEVIPLFITFTGELFILPWIFLHRGKISDFEYRLVAEAKKIMWDEVSTYVDFMYVAAHGRGIEDGILAGCLEVLGIPYLGSGVLASALAMDKVRHNALLAYHGIEVPKSYTVRASEIKKQDTGEFSRWGIGLASRCEQVGIMMPVVVKPAHEGSSLGVSVVQSEPELAQACYEASRCGGYDYQDVLIEEYIQGFEFCTVFLESVTEHEDGITTSTWKPLSITEVVHESESYFFDYTQKYMPGRAHRITPARCDSATAEKIYAVCQRIIRLIEFRSVARFDGFVTQDGRVVIIDSNPISGMGPSFFLFHQAAEVGMSHGELINHLIGSELKRRGMRTEFNVLEQRIIHCTNNQRLRVAVFFGGNSAEREISLESGRNVCYKLSPQKYLVTPVFVREDGQLFELSSRLLVQNSTAEIAEQVTDAMRCVWTQVPERFDFVFLALHGGAGENGSMQGLLELLGIPYNGSGVLASALCMDKFRLNEFLRSGGFSVANSQLLTRDQYAEYRQDTEKYTQWREQLLKQVGLPCILKPHDDGCSTLVRKIINKDELDSAVTWYFAHTSKSAVMLEEYIVGTELTIGVIGNDEPRALPPSQPVVHGAVLSLEEKFLPGAGENRTPADLPDEVIALVQREIERVYRAVGCSGYARIDCFYRDGNVIILEINTLPALTPATCLFHQAAEVGVRPSEFLDRVIEFGFERYALRKNKVNAAVNVSPNQCSSLTK